ncbi:MAG: hypothetical protein ACXIVQ_18010 [Acidimicrobiales bacterium]
MSDPMREPTEDEITYADTREDQAELQGLIDEKDGDYQEAVDAKEEGEEPDEPRRNASMP